MLQQRTAYSELLSPTPSPNLLPSNGRRLVYQIFLPAPRSDSIVLTDCTYDGRGRAVRDYDFRVSALLHLILLLVQQSQTSCYVTGYKVCVLPHTHTNTLTLYREASHSGFCGSITSLDSYCIFHTTQFALVLLDVFSYLI